MSGLKSVARIVIGTEKNRYLFIVPNIDHAGTKQLIQEAKERAALVNAKETLIANKPSYSLLFEFENERMEIAEMPLFIHQYIKQENYAFDTPTINVHNR